MINVDTKTAAVSHCDMLFMSDLIDEALAEAGGRPLDNIDPDWCPVAHAAVRRLVSSRGKTGPLYHKGILFRASEGETFTDSIEVIDGVRFASEVLVPTDQLAEFPEAS